MDAPYRGFVITDDRSERLHDEPITDPVEATEFLGRLLDEVDPVVGEEPTQAENLSIAAELVRAAELYGVASAAGLTIVC